MLVCLQLRDFYVKVFFFFVCINKGESAIRYAFSVSSNAKIFFYGGTVIPSYNHNYRHFDVLDYHFIDLKQIEEK